jgi:uncharacterized protein
LIYLYLHGFASEPRSRKAQYLANQFASRGITLHLPDLNQGGFPSLTISRQLQQAATYLTGSEPVTVIGSSLGGWLALLLAQHFAQIEQLVLLAPAFGFPELWLERLGTEALQTWQQSGQLAVYHYVEKQQLPLQYQFVTDAQQYLASNLERQLPTLILHGQADAVVPIELSRNFLATHPWAQFIELASDHGLGDVLNPIWQEISRFCELTPPSS